jgi:hypothetical protein
MTKICSRCKLEKEDSYFNKRNDKLISQCKECVAKYKKEYLEKHHQEILKNKKEYYQNNKEKILEKTKIYTILNKDKKKLYDKKRYYLHCEIIKKLKREHYYKNKFSYLQRNKKNNIRRYNSDIKYKLKSRLSSEIRKHLLKMNLSKSGESIINYLPYSIEELKKHIESLFENWMNWENHGIYDSETWDDNDQSTWTWQIDHIIPHSKFNYHSMKDKEFLECWDLKNLRPLSSKQNIIDGNRRKIRK